MAGDNSGMMMMLVLVLGLVCSGCVSMSGLGVAMSSNPELQAKLKAFFNFGGATTAGGGEVSADGTYTSSEILTGARGTSKFSASCPSGRFVKRIYMRDRQYGGGNSRHGRVAFLGLMCSDGKDKMAIGTKSQMGTNLECTKGMTSVATWKTSDAVQQINAFCQDGNNASILGVNSRKANTGSAIGDGPISVNCPEGMWISGVSGTYDIREDEKRDESKGEVQGANAIRSWQWKCSKPK
jgi:hypothetical protein